MASAEVKKEIDDTRALAAKLGIQGTPHFLVGDRIIPGAPENLFEQMQKTRRRCPQGGLQGLLAALEPVAMPRMALISYAKPGARPFPA